VAQNPITPAPTHAAGEYVDIGAAVPVGDREIVSPGLGDAPAPARLERADAGARAARPDGESRLVLMTGQEENELSAAGRHDTGTFLAGSRNGMAAVWPVTEPSDAWIRSSVPGPACSTGTQT
jgi:hypothetical protein